MKGSSYRDLDYGFGQTMLSLRTRLRLTQVGLANFLGVSRRAVGDWEAGKSYPNIDHLKKLIVLAIEGQAFPIDRQAQEIRALWLSAHQKTRLDEDWLAVQLPFAAPPASPPEEAGPGDMRVLAPAVTSPRLDWDTALAIPSFYGRAWELNLLNDWVVVEHCRVVSLVGLGGIGKSALAVSLMHRVAEHFEAVIWRSLRDQPTLDGLFDDLLQFLAPQVLKRPSASLEERQGALLDQMRDSRILLVLDNLETVLEEGLGSGRMRPGYASLGRFLSLSAATEHHSCLLLTSREKPGDLVPLEGNRSPVRTLRLARLDVASCEQLLDEKEVKGNASERARLIEAYTGNPLALKIVAQTILDLFGGAIAPFLEQGEIIFGGVRELLAEQFDRLSVLEQSVLRWLAILREPATLEELAAVWTIPLPRAHLLEAIGALHRRSLIERGQQPGSFTLQSVVLEYTTARLIAEASREVESGRLSRLIEHGLELAQAREYVRQTQERLILTLILERLRALYPQQAELEQHLMALLDQFTAQDDPTQGYGPANLVTLLRLQRGDLRGLDLSHLALRGVYLQGVEMQDASLNNAALTESVFTETFDAIWAVAASPDGQYWAAGSKRGEVRIWAKQGQTLLGAWQAHADIVPALTFSPDASTLASGSVDGTLKLWEVASSTLLWSQWHSNNVNDLAYSPGGSLLASAGNDAMVRLWDPHSGLPVQTLQHPGPVFAVAWSPQGDLLASGDFEGCIRLWSIRKAQPAACVQTLYGHTDWVRGLAFAPDGRLLASASFDNTVRLWDITKSSLYQTLVAHTDRVQKVAWSPDGRTLASSGLDKSILLWDTDQNTVRAVLRGHSAPIYGLAFTSDSHTLLSGSDDGTLRVWDVARGQSIRLVQGYAPTLYDLDWSPDGAQVASCSTDALVTIWDVDGSQSSAGGKEPSRVMRGHDWVVFGVSWRPDGGLLASSGWDAAVCLWDPTTGARVERQQIPDLIFYGLAWSPDGGRLACGTYLHGVLVWELAEGSVHWFGREHPTRFPRVTWSPDSTQLASGGYDGHVYLWDVNAGASRLRLSGHQGAIKSVAWSPAGGLLASGGGKVGGELYLWDVRGGKPVSSLADLPGIVTALAWGPSEALLVSGGEDGSLQGRDMPSGKVRWAHQAHQGAIQSLRRSPDGTRLASCGNDGAILLWDAASGELLQTLRRDRPYERLDISGVRGLTQAQKETLLILGAFEQPPR